MEARNDSITFKVSTAEKEKIELASEVEHTDKSEFCRRAALKHADKVHSDTVLNPIWKSKWEGYKRKVKEWQKTQIS